MIKDHGILLRSIPYSDSARILHCFTENNGLLALFTRLGKRRMAGHLQAGSLIEFTAKDKSGADLLTLIDSRWDPGIPTDSLGGEEAALWLFAVELLQRSLKERLILPQLYHRMATYYGYLSQAEIAMNPIVPLVVISSQLGLSDVAMVFCLADAESLEALQLLGVGRDQEIKASTPQTKEAFNIELERFQQHFGIDHLGSLDLITL